jgi:hypothetical protein
MTMSGGRGVRVAAACVALGLAAAHDVASAPLAARVALDRSQAEVGEPVGYLAWVTIPTGAKARWLHPDSSVAYELAGLRARRAQGPEADTLAVAGVVRAWQTGPIGIPGLRVEVQGEDGAEVHRLPAVQLQVASVLAEGRPPELRPWRVPLDPPWWERVPWRWVAAGALALAGLVLLVRALRRRAPAQPEAARPLRDPAEEALQALAALRQRRLPEAGRFAEHAFELGGILRRYLEATLPTPRPGDTTPELVDHLEQARVVAAELERMRGLLAGWDEIKFAQRASDAATAQRAEQAVEAHVKKHASRREAA